jgi:hypothetical protein
MQVFVTGAQAQWRMHKNTGAGFSATATNWNVPPSGLAEGFTMPASAAPMRHWATVDLDGDGKVDLVQTSSTTATAVISANGHTSWNFFKNSGTAFASTASAWPVPPNGLSDGFYAAEISAGTRAWTLLDLDGDKRPELVHTADPASGRVWGPSSFWTVYRNEGAGFSATASTWTMPASGLPDGFFWRSASAGGRQWTTVDLDGDGAVELVQTASATTGSVFGEGTGAVSWKVYRAVP